MPEAMQQATPMLDVLNGCIGREQGCVGAICLDQQGFTLGSSGDLLPTQASAIVGLMDTCSQLKGGGAKAPVITLETSMRTLSVSRQGELVAALARKPAES
mmetsp:Transcript_37788/g.82950  ORF Transcript_37788/g.82950 Transcript_37788/m.82950 type:complete len:101 (-) Transcript_37788:101-403(-)